MAGYVTVSGYKAQYGITSSDDDVTLTLLIDAISNAIDAECRREGRLWNRNVTETLDMIAGGTPDIIDSNQFSNIEYSAGGKNHLTGVRGTKYHVKNTPVVSVSGIRYKDSNDNWITDTKNVYAYPEFIAFDTPYTTNKRQAVELTFVSGFFDPDSIPEDLQMLTNQLVHDEMTKIKNNVSSFVKSKRIGGTSHSYDLTGNSQFGSGSPVFEAIVAKYRKSIEYGNI